jgi:hypothetical protein
VPRPAERQQLGQESRDLAERRECGIPGRDMGQLGCDRALAEVDGGDALRLGRAPAGADEQPSDPHRHVAERGAEPGPAVAFAGQPAPARLARATALARHGHLRRHELGLQRRREPLRLGEPQPELGQAGLPVAPDAGDLGLGRHAGSPLRDQLHPPHQLRHQLTPLP